MEKYKIIEKHLNMDRMNQGKAFSDNCCREAQATRSRASSDPNDKQAAAKGKGGLASATNAVGGRTATTTRKKEN
jgi:hypothetical protein